MNKDQIIGIIRHALTFAGGAIVAKGLASEEVVVELTGALITAIGAIWSIVVKMKTEEPK